MRISVLLPTRDRLDLLTRAVASVKCLNDPDWEIVISDNSTSGHVETYITSLNDGRIRYVRTGEVMSITENWNNALAHSSGDYVVMLGDDDALLDGYFRRTRRLIADFDSPQVIYHNALGYAYPGVIPGEPDGFLRSEGYARFLRGAERPFRLPCDQARSVAREVADFRLSYGFNMQFVTISRAAIEALSRDGKFFHSPFPDYYAMNHLFACAHSLVVEPQPLVVIGISRQSYGFFFYNHREREGKAFLEGNKTSGERASGQPRLLPGTHINNGWLQAVEELYRQLGHPADFRPSYRRYRMLQILHVYTGSRLLDTVDADELSELRRMMTRLERLAYGLLFTLLAMAARILPTRARAHVPRVPTLIARQLPWWNPVRRASHYRNITEVIDEVASEDEVAQWGLQQGWRLGSRILARIFP
jgi:glycosyltransferase involved in cell wall biosynthesis